MLPPSATSAYLTRPSTLGNGFTCVRLNAFDILTFTEDINLTTAMDGISAAASIIGVSTAGVQVSMKLYNLSKLYASERINWISNEVNFTSSVLREISVLMDCKSSEEVDSIFCESSLRITTKSTNTCRRVIMALQTMLSKVSHGSSTENGSSQGKATLSRAERVHWLFNSDRADDLLYHLGKAKDSLMFVLQLATLGYAKKAAKR